MNRLDFVEKEDLRRDLPPFRVGDTVRVHASGNTPRISVWRTRYFNQDTRLLRRGPFTATAAGKVRGSHAVVPTHPALEVTGNLSLEAWIRPVNTGGNQFHGILSKYSAPNDAAYMINLMPSGQLSAHGAEQFAQIEAFCAAPSFAYCCSPSFSQP